PAPPLGTTRLGVAADGTMPKPIVAAPSSPLPTAPRPAVAQPSVSQPPVAKSPVVQPSATLPTETAQTAKRKRGPAEILPVDFNGVTLGESSLEDVTAAWGKPLEKSTEQGTTRCRYAIEPFASVDVAYADNKAL